MDIFWSYWPDLNRRPIARPKNAFIFGDPSFLISRSRQFKKKKNETTEKSIVSSLELLAGLEPATC